MGETLLEATQIGKECHTRCAIFYQAMDCVMPKEGIFARVLHGGVVKPGDGIVVIGHVSLGWSFRRSVSWWWQSSIFACLV